MDFIFIIGVARTGSKIYRNIINDNTDIDIINEILLFQPFLIKDVDYYINKICKRNKNNVNNLIDIMYSGNILRGTFWKNKKNNRIFEIDKEILRKKISQREISTQNIFENILIEHAKVKKKSRGGAKFPVNIKYFNNLFSWFPKAYYLHIIRDPRAIYYSMVKGDLKKNKRILKTFIYIFRLVYLIDQYKAAHKLHIKNMNKCKYLLIKFEDMVNNPEQKLLTLCNFIDVEYTENMLYPKMQNSSFNIEKSSGINKKTLTNWREGSNKYIIKIIEILLYKEMKYFNYL